MKSIQTKIMMLAGTYMLVVISSGFVAIVFASNEHT